MTLDVNLRVKRRDFELDVDFSIPAHGVNGLLGPSGSGKTTLLRAIAGLERQPVGRLAFNNVIWQKNASFVPSHRRALGYVFQESSLFPHLTVRKNLEYGYKRASDENRRLSLQEIIELFSLGKILTRKPDTLSGGERQRVAIARALASDPELLLMDEPLAALDNEARFEILPYLEALHAQLKIAVIYVSHTVDEVISLADNLILLEAGKILAVGEVNEILTRLDLPLARRSGATSVVESTVTGHDEEYHLTKLVFSGGHFLVPRQNLRIGDLVRLRLAAKDVSLTLKQQTETSIQNIFPAKVLELKSDGCGRVTLRLKAGNDIILSSITEKSANELGLKRGTPVFAQVKSVVVMP